MPREESTQHHASDFDHFIVSSAAAGFQFTTLTLNVTETGPGWKPEQQDKADCCTVTQAARECLRAHAQACVCVSMCVCV